MVLNITRLSKKFKTLKIEIFYFAYVLYRKLTVGSHACYLAIMEMNNIKYDSKAYVNYEYNVSHIQNKIQTYN